MCTVCVVRRKRGTQKRNGISKFLIYSRHYFLSLIHPGACPYHIYNLMNYHQSLWTLLRLKSRTSCVPRKPCLPDYNPPCPSPEITIILLSHTTVNFSCFELQVNGISECAIGPDIFCSVLCLWGSSMWLWLSDVHWFSLLDRIRLYFCIITYLSILALMDLWVSLVLAVAAFSRESFCTCLL